MNSIAIVPTWETALCAAIQWVNPEQSKLVWNAPDYQEPDADNWFAHPLINEPGFVRISAVRYGPNTIAVHFHRKQQKRHDVEFYRRVEDLGRELVWEYYAVNDDRRVHAIAMRYFEGLLENRSVAVILSNHQDVIQEAAVLGPYISKVKREYYSHQCLSNINTARITHLCVADPQPGDDRLWLGVRCESIEPRQTRNKPFEWWDPKSPTNPSPEHDWGNLSFARVNVEDYHDFQTCNVYRDGHIQCIGLLFRKVDGSRHVFGQWRDDKAQNERHTIPSDLVFCSISNEINCFVHVQPQAADEMYCVPIRGELEWFYSAKNSQVQPTDTLLF